MEDEYDFSKGVRGRFYHPDTKITIEPNNKEITWKSMKKYYPDEWLLITNFNLDKDGHLISGVVRRHSKIKQEVYRLPALGESTAFRYTGESTFSGSRSYAKK